MLEAHNNQDVTRRRGCKGCPPHGPHLVDAAREGLYVARCLACGLAGPSAETTA